MKQMLPSQCLTVGTSGEKLLNRNFFSFEELNPSSYELFMNRAFIIVV